MISRELIKKVRQIEIAARRKVTTRFAGGYLSTFRGQGMEFDEVREYAPGDDIRTIDWNVTARTGQAFIKRFIVEREMAVLLVVDISGSLGFGSGAQSKAALVSELATLLAFLVIGNGDRVGLVLVSDQIERFIPPGNGKKHLYRVIREMSTHVRQHTGTDLGQALDFAARMVPRHSTVFVISDFLMPPEDLDKPLSRLSRRHDVIAVSVSDPREMDLPAMGLLRVQDPESGDVVTVDSSDPVFRRAFTAMERQRRDDLWRILVRHGIDRVPLVTTVSYMKPLMKFFHTRSRRLR